MTYALIVNDQATVVQSSLPSSARRQDTNDWVLGIADAPVALQQACGWFAVTDTVRPADTATTTTDRTIQNVAGTWTVVWVSRNKTPAEVTAATALTNQSAILTNLAQDLAAMQTIIDTANATINSNPAAHIKTIARMLRRLGRLASNDLTGSD